MVKPGLVFHNTYFKLPTEPQTKEIENISKLIDFIRNLFDEYKILALIIVIIFAGRSSFLDWNHVSTGSMRPAIIEGDRVVIDKRAYDFALPFTSWKVINIGSPSRGEIIIFKKHDNPQLLIKRIVGLPRRNH